MTETAVLLQENMTRFCPVTNLYGCGDFDGEKYARYLLITVNHLDAVGTLMLQADKHGFGDELGLGETPIVAEQVQSMPTDVFLAEVTGIPIFDVQVKDGVDEPTSPDDLERVQIDVKYDIGIVDADGDPANGMTPMLRLPPGTSFAEALAAAGCSPTDSRPSDG